MARIVIDPLTRIEGHLRIEAQVDGGAISDAWSSGTMFRGLELVVRNRDPREAWYWLQRICSVCTMVHALASVRAVEDALEIEVPDNARLVRNLIAGAQMVQDHVVHFYHLQALDWVDVANAIKADPVKTAQIAGSLSDWSKSGASHFRAVQATGARFGGERPIEPVHQRLLGPSGVPSAARSEPARRFPLSRRTGISARLYTHTRGAGRQESPPADVPGGRNVDGHGPRFSASSHQSGTSDNSCAR